MAKNRIIRIFIALTMCLFVALPVLAQNNLIPANIADFTIHYVGNAHTTNYLGYAGVDTDYEYVSWENGLLGDDNVQHYAIGTNARWYSNHSVFGIETGMFDMGDHTTGDGNYMIVNGATSSYKRVWEYTVDVTPGVEYQFQVYVTALYMYPYGDAPDSQKPKLRLKINNSNVGPIYTVPWNGNSGQWAAWTQNWTAGANVTTATITIIDNCYEGNGNDFGLDDISFTPTVVYSVDAIDDPDISACLDQYVYIDVLANDIVAPNPDDAVVTLVDQNTWPSYGIAEVRPNKRIRYKYTGGGNGTDQIKYRVTNHGVYDEAWVYINTISPPQVDDIEDPGPICADGALNIPTPSVTPYAEGTWEYCSTPNGTNWQSFNPLSVPHSLNGMYIRYTATNCSGSGHSENPVQLVVAVAPTIGAPDTPPAICEGGSFSLTTPTVDDHGSTITHQGWQIAATEDGPYDTFSNNDVPYTYNHYWIRYYAENDCDSAFSTSVQVTVNAAPVVPDITPPVGVCEGDELELTPPNNIDWRHNDLTTCWGSWEILIDGVWDSLVNDNIPFDYNGCYIRYKAVNGCGIPSYSTNEVQITVYSTAPVDEGNFTACDAIYHHGILCDSTGLYVVNDSITSNGCHIQVSWHFTLGEAYEALPETPVECDSYIWPRTGLTYYTDTIVFDTVFSNDPLICDSIFTLELTINHAPEFLEPDPLQAPPDICANLDEFLAVTQPDYLINQSNGGGHRWEFANSPNGPFIPFNPTTHHFEYGSYYLRFAVINSCDSIFSNIQTFYVNDAPVVSVVNGQLMDMEICEGNVPDWPQVAVEWNNQPDGFRTRRWEKALSSEGPYLSFDTTAAISNESWIRYYVQNSCDEAILGPVHVSVISVQDEWEPHEDCDVVVFDGLPYTSDTVIDVLVDEPCPHTIHHNIVVHHSEYIMETIPQTTCHDEFEWHGQIYYRSNGLEQLMHFDTVTEHNCSKVLEQMLIFDNYSSDIEYGIGCGTYYWYRNDSTYVYDENNTHIQDSWFIPGDGIVCDSIIYLSLDLGRDYPEEEGEHWTRCSGFEWHGIPCYQDTIVMDSLKTKITHCDSIVYHQITIIQPFDTLVEMVSCEPYEWQGHQFFEDGSWTVQLQSTVTGCDSIVTMNFRLDDFFNEFDTIACEPFEWYEFECNQPNHDYVIQHVFASSMGCDSTVVKRVHVNNPVGSTGLLTKCAPYLFPYNGIIYDEPGVYLIDTGVSLSQYGCDSIIYHVRLTVLDSEQIGEISGNSYAFVASSLTSGIYRYEIDTTSIIGSVSWSISNPEWRILDHDEVSCRVLILTPGRGELIAHFRAPCGELDRSFDINATFYGLEDFDVIPAKVYPNPTQGTLTVETEGIESIRLTNMMGQVLDWRDYDRCNSATLNLNGFTPSVYLLEIKTVYGMVKKRVVLSR